LGLGPSASLIGNDARGEPESTPGGSLGVRLRSKTAGKVAWGRSDKGARRRRADLIFSRQRGSPPQGKLHHFKIKGDSLAWRVRNEGDPIYLRGRIVVVRKETPTMRIERWSAARDGLFQY